MTASFRLLTFNVLLPNGTDGWWIQKMYRPETPPERRAWPQRQRLLARVLEEQAADICCLQELCAESFEDDWRFLHERGYASLLHRKGRLRMATFWRTPRFALQQAHHLDRVLVTSLRDGDRPLHVVNCHLITGPNPDRRLRQVYDALGKLERSAQPTDAVIVCGDFNTSVRSAVHELLERTLVGPDFRARDQAPDQPATSRVRSHPFGPMRDIYAGRPGPRPPTFVAPRLHAWMCDPQGRPSDALLSALCQLYARFQSGPDPIWGPAEVERWLVLINGRPDRGSEVDELAALHGEGAPWTLTLEQLAGIYLRSLAAGKFWSIDYDLRAAGIACPDPPIPPYEAVLDYVYASEALTVEAVVEPWTEEQRRRVREEGEALPNTWHPSDHLPVCASFAWTPAVASGGAEP